MNNQKITNDNVYKYMNDYFIEYGHYPTHFNMADNFNVSRQRITQVVKNLLIKRKLTLARDDNRFMVYDYRYPLMENVEAVIEALRIDKKERRL